MNLHHIKPHTVLANSKLNSSILSVLLDFPKSPLHHVHPKEAPSVMEREPDSNFQFPPGFRFHPSDEELIVHYLQKKVTSRPLPASVIAEIDLYKYNPWELPKKALFGEDEWYFFSPRDRKYPNGVRPNRAAGSGYWKATGTDKPILTSCGSKSIGVKKALVFYISQSPKGFKTGWIMNEYRLLDTMIRPSRLKGTMRLDDWVLCRVRKKGNFLMNSCEGQESPTAESMKYLPFIEESPPTSTNNTGVFMDYLRKGCPLLATILGGQPLPPVQTISSVSLQGSNKSSSVYDDGLDTSPITVSSFDGLFNPLKRKEIKENIHKNLPPSKMTLTSDKKYEILPEKMMVNTDINFYSNQSQEDIFNSNPSNPIINLQQLQDELAFTERYLQE